MRRNPYWALAAGEAEKLATAYPADPQFPINLAYCLRQLGDPAAAGRWQRRADSLLGTSGLRGPWSRNGVRDPVDSGLLPPSLCNPRSPAGGRFLTWVTYSSGRSSSSWSRRRRRRRSWAPFATPRTASPSPGAVVMLTDLGRAVPTDSTGRYELPLVPAGPQHVVVRGLGYVERSMHALVPREGTLEINVALDPAPIPCRPTRCAARSRSAASTAATPARFPSARCRSRPRATIRCSGEPDAIQALSGGEVVMDPETPSGVSIRGGASDQNGIRARRHSRVQPYHAAGLSRRVEP